MDSGARCENSLGAWVWIFLLVISLSLLTFGCDTGETFEKKHELKSGDTVIIKYRLSPRHMMAGGRDLEYSSIFIHWKQSAKTEAVVKRLKGYGFDPQELTLVTNKDYFVLMFCDVIWWRNRSQAGQWNFYQPTNSPAIWTFLKNYARTQLPDSYYKITKASAGETITFWSHPAEIWLLEWSSSVGCNKIQVDFERHRLVASCLENDRFPKLVFVEDGQFGRWKFDERASQVENQSAAAVP
jgi:hypothetical protein